MNETRRLQIHAYLKTYFQDIRHFIQSEPLIEQFVPQLFKFKYLFLVFECKDGYVVAAYPSGFADNYFYFHKEENVKSVIASLPNLIPGTEAHVVLDLDNWGGSGMRSGISDTVETKNGPLPTGGWKFLNVATLDFDWPVSDAHENAEGIIALIKERTHVYSPDQGHFLTKYESVLEERGKTERLYQILEAYKSIIDEKSYKERTIHRFLFEHPFILESGKKQIFYEHPLKDENGNVCYRIDFVIELTTGRYILVELENPKHELFTSKGEFRQIVNHAENSQVLQWMLWIRQHFNLIAGTFPGIVAPEGLIIVGRSSNLDIEQRNLIRMWNEKHEIKLKTYDELAEEAENYIKHFLDI
jgi:hypothetical protein